MSTQTSSSSEIPPDQLEEGGEEEAHVAEMPMTMAASVVLDHLPRDAHQALDEAVKAGRGGVPEKSEFDFCCFLCVLGRGRFCVWFFYCLRCFVWFWV